MEQGYGLLVYDDQKRQMFGLHTAHLQHVNNQSFFILGAHSVEFIDYNTGEKCTLLIGQTTNTPTEVLSRWKRIKLIIRSPLTFSRWYRTKRAERGQSTDGT